MEIIVDDELEKNTHTIQETLTPIELANEIGLGYYRCSRDGKVLQVNELLTNLLEYQSSEELVSSGVPANLNKHMLGKTVSSPDNPVTTQAVIKLKTKKGRQVWLEIRLRTVKDEHENPVFNEGFVKDITVQMSELETLKNDNQLLAGVEEQFQDALGSSHNMITRLMKEIPSPSAELLSAVEYFNSKILVIDDDETITDIFGEFFTEKGFLVQTASNGNDALNIFQSFQPDIIISDIMMPGMDGLTLQEKFRDLKPEQKIILITGDKSKESAKTLMNAMDIPMLFKPINIRNDLWNVVKEQLGIASTR
ncbi:response regulator [Candidatus Marinimicrobia bacterium MT.SAG.3]|nr:response regulator [Candidatus Marinimicrobia bacterium MT.SAG.3]